MKPRYFLIGSLALFLLAFFKVPMNVVCWPIFLALVVALMITLLLGIKPLSQRIGGYTILTFLLTALWPGAEQIAEVLLWGLYHELHVEAGVSTGRTLLPWFIGIGVLSGAVYLVGKVLLSLPRREKLPRPSVRKAGRSVNPTGLPEWGKRSQREAPVPSRPGNPGDDLGLFGGAP